MSPEVSVALVGAGHAHIEVIRRFREHPIPGARLCVFDPNPRPIYSGMVPGFVAGQYERHELEIDLAALCDQPRVEFVRRAVAAIDADAQEIHFEDRAPVHYDVASLDIGSTVAGAELPGVREFALASRPIAGLIEQVEKLFERPSGSTARPLRVHVVGAGAGGVELAFCLEARLRREASLSFEISLITSDPGVLYKATKALRRRVERALERRGIRTLANRSVTAIREDAIEFENGETAACTAALWVTGPAAHPLAAASTLPTDARGFVSIRPTLQVEGRDDLFAVGDCASLPGMKKAGVYAVRAGPLIDHNLRARLAREALRSYTPQGDFLSLLNLGDGTAIGAKWGLALEGRAVMRLKDRIDRGFMQKYQ